MWFKRVFEWKEDEDFGGEGWIMKDMPHFNAVEDFGFAHDVLEHFDYGTDLKHEMMAFGAMQYIRAEGGWWYSYGRNFHSPAENMAGDVARFLHEHKYQIEACRTTKLDEDTEHDLKELADKTYKYALDESEWELKEGIVTREDIRVGIHYAMHWIRRGYRKCVKRWHGASAASLADLFEEIRQEAGKYKHGNFNDTLTVSVNTRTHEFRFKHKEWRDPYAY